MVEPRSPSAHDSSPTLTAPSTPALLFSHSKFTRFSLFRSQPCEAKERNLQGWVLMLSIPGRVL